MKHSQIKVQFSNAIMIALLLCLIKDSKQQQGACPSGQFSNASTQTCDDCLSNCIQCTTASDCQKCQVTLLIQNDSDGTHCQSGCAVGYNADATKVFCEIDSRSFGFSVSSVQDTDEISIVFEKNLNYVEYALMGSLPFTDETQRTGIIPLDNICGSWTSVPPRFLIFDNTTDANTVQVTASLSQLAECGFTNAISGVLEGFVVIIYRDDIYAPTAFSHTLRVAYTGSIDVHINDLVLKQIVGVVVDADKYNNQGMLQLSALSQLPIVITNALDETQVGSSEYPLQARRGDQLLLKIVLPSDLQSVYDLHLPLIATMVDKTDNSQFFQCPISITYPAQLADKYNQYFLDVDFSNLQLNYQGQFELAFSAMLSIAPGIKHLRMLSATSDSTFNTSEIINMNVAATISLFSNAIVNQQSSPVNNVLVDNAQSSSHALAIALLCVLGGLLIVLAGVIILRKLQLRKQKQYLKQEQTGNGSGGSIQAGQVI